MNKQSNFLFYGLIIFGAVSFAPIWLWAIGLTQSLGFERMATLFLCALISGAVGGMGLSP